jgi:hypothetical protein
VTLAQKVTEPPRTTLFRLAVSVVRVAAIARTLLFFIKVQPVDGKAEGKQSLTHAT